MDSIKSTVLIHPGLGNSEPDHWQALWIDKYDFKKIEQRDFDAPICEEWIDHIEQEVRKHDPANVILVGHSLACTAIAYWASKYKTMIKGALLVGPSDTEADSYPSGTTGFTPVPVETLPFPSIVVASTNDFYVSAERAQAFADAWGSCIVWLENAGHINVAAGFGVWEEGLHHLQELDNGNV